MPYERKAIYPLEEVFAHIGPKDHDFDGDMVHMDSLRYKVFKKQLCCASCGMKGEYFAKERSIRKDGELLNGERYHFNMYGHNDKGEEILFTKDHINPKSKGGPDRLENMQTMCVVCNSAKGSDVPSDIILANAISKHKLDKLAEMDHDTIISLINYVRLIGYSEGWKDHTEEIKIKEQRKKDIAKKAHK